MSIPPLISMFLQYSYNLIDSAFVAQLSENALTAVSLSFPITTLMNAASIWIASVWMYWLQGILDRKSRMMQIQPSHMDCYWPLELVLCSIFCHYWLWNPIFGRLPVMKKSISWALPIWACVRSCKFPIWCISPSRRWYRPPEYGCSHVFSDCGSDC